MENFIFCEVNPYVFYVYKDKLPFQEQFHQRWCDQEAYSH